MLSKLILILFIVFCVFSGKKISIRHYTIETSFIKKDSIIKIVLLSDLHSTIFGKNQNQLVKKIKEQNPDLILLSGDILDDEAPHIGTELLLSNIDNIAPIYYVTGNHEYWSHNIEQIRELILSYKVIILSDNYVRINIKGNEFILAGIEDPDKKYYEVSDYNQYISMEKAFRELDKEGSYKILLAHRPENIENYRNFSFDLILSGHTHGGQVRLPFILNGLFAPNQGFFPKYGGGLYKHGKLIHIISRGLSVNPILPRIFNPPEMVVVTLNSDK